MSLEVRLAELSTIINQTLGPDGSHTQLLQELRQDFRKHVEEDNKVHRGVDRLEQQQKARSKLFWAASTAWVGIVIAWSWDRLTKR